MAYDNRPLLVESNRAGILCRAEQLDLAKSVLGLAYVIGQSAVAVNLTGTLALTTLASVTLPGGLLGANGSVLIELIWSRTNTAQSINTYAGNITLLSVFPGAGQLVMRSHVHLANRGNEASQVSANAALNPNSNGAGALLALALNTAVDQTLTFQAQLANVGDSITLEAWRVTAYPT